MARRRRTTRLESFLVPDSDDIPISDEYLGDDDFDVFPGSAQRETSKEDECPRS